MQMVINLAPVSLSNKKSEHLHLPKIDFSEEKCHGKCLQEHFLASRFQNFLAGHTPRPPWRLAPSALETCLVLFCNLSTALVTRFYRVLNGVSRCYTVIHVVTGCYTGFHGVTRCFVVLHVVTGCYTVFHGVTQC